MMIPKKARKHSLNRAPESFTRRNFHIHVSQSLRNPKNGNIYLNAPNPQKPVTKTPQTTAQSQHQNAQPPAPSQHGQQTSVSNTNVSNICGTKSKSNIISSRIRLIDQQMKELFIHEDEIDELSSLLKSALLSGSKGSAQHNSTGETFFTFWNSYVQSITAHLQQPTESRCLNYISLKFDKVTNSISSNFFTKINNFIFFDEKENNNNNNNNNSNTNSNSNNNSNNGINYQRLKNKIEKNKTDINNDFQKLQILIENAKDAPEKDQISKISDITYPFDCFYHDIISKYTLFFESIFPDKTTRDPILKELYKNIKSIVDITFAASKLTDLKNRFIQNINDTSDLFCKLFKRPLNKNMCNTETKVTHKHRHTTFYVPSQSTTSDKCGKNFRFVNKTDVFQNETPRKSIRKAKNGDDSSSGKDKLISMAVLSESIEEDAKILPKPTKIQTISKSKLDHLNHKFSNEQQQQNKHNNYNNNNNNVNTNSTNNNNNNVIVTNILNNNIKKESNKNRPQQNKTTPITGTNNNNNLNNNNLNNNLILNNVNVNNNVSVKKQICVESQFYGNRSKEAQLVAQLDTISQQNEQLKIKHQQLTDQLNKIPHHAKVDSLNREIALLKTSLSSIPDGHDEISSDIQIVRENIDFLKEIAALLADEIEPCKQINNNLTSSNDDTVTFDNLRLRKACDELRERLRKMQNQLEELRNQKNRSLFITEIVSSTCQTLTNEDKLTASNLISLDSRLIKRENARLETKLSSLINEYNFSSQVNDNGVPIVGSGISSIFFNKDRLAICANAKKISSRIAQLEEMINSIRKSQNDDELFKMRNSYSEVKKLERELSLKIDKYINDDYIQMKRKAFDSYEQLKEQSRELQIEYFSLQKTITMDMDASERYSIELQMEDIQDQYTMVMMEIERIGKTANQECLHENRKERTRGRKEMARFMEQENQVSLECLESERRVIDLERESRNLMGKTKDREHEENGYLKRITEVLADRVQTQEIIRVIDEQTKQFNLELTDGATTSERQRIEDLKETVEKLINNGGPKMKQKLRIFNLQKEIEAFNQQ